MITTENELMFQMTVPQFSKMLANINILLDKAVAHAEAKKYDVSVLLNHHLAPDQFNFIRQIQIACDNAKGCVARLAGKEPPKHEDNEKTVEELRARVKKTIAYLGERKASEFVGWQERKIDIGFMPGKYVEAPEFLTEMAVPNVYFHIVTAYAILRNSGVDVGKLDFLGNINFRQK